MDNAKMTGDEWLDQARRNGALTTGPGYPATFAQGWGRPAFMRGSMVAHHWSREAFDPAELVKEYGAAAEGAYAVRSACGLFALATARVPLLQQGNLPYCSRCENRLMRAMKGPQG